MRKILSFLLMLVMAVSAFTPAFAANSDGVSLLADDVTFYACLLGKGSGNLQFGLGEYYLSSDTMQIYQNINAERMFAATYVKTPEDEGIYAMFERIDSMGAISDEVLVRYDSIDDFKRGKFEEIGHASTRITAMAMDYTTNMIYAMDENRTLYRIDRAGGSVTPCAEIKTTRLPIVMSIDDHGDVYVITYGGLLCRVDKFTGEAVEIGATGTDPEYQQSMTFDHNTNTMYWFMTDSSGGFGDYGTYTVDLNTANVNKLNKSADCTVLGAFTVPESVEVPDSVPVTNIELNRTELSMIERQTFDLDATVYPLDKYVSRRDVTWSSTNEEVATVSAAGTVTALSKGSTTVKAISADGGFSAECKITVSGLEESYRDISDVLNKAEYGTDGYVFYVTDKSETGYPFVVSENSSRGTIVTSTNIDVDGSVSYVENAYPVKLTGGSTVKFSYYVSSDPDDIDGFYFYVNGVMLDPEKDGNNYSYRGNVPWTTYEYKVPRTGEYTFRWEYSKNYFLGSGEDRMGIEYIEYNMAEPKPIERISLVPNNAEVLEGKTTQLTVEFTPQNAEYQNLTFTSDNEAVATVDANGVVTGVSDGTARITATTEDGHSATATVTVVPVKYVEEMTFTPAKVGSTYNFELNQYVKFAGQIKLAVGYSVEVSGGEGVIIDLNEAGKDPITDTTLYVYDENFDLVAYNEDDPYDYTTFYSYIRFAPTKEGKHTYNIVITTNAGYEYDYGTGAMQLTAFEPVHVTGVTVPSTTVNMKVGQLSQIQAILTPVENDYPTVIYESSDTSVVTVSNSGLMSAAALGTATVTVFVPDGGHRVDIKVIVTEDGEGSIPEYDGNIYGFTLYTEESQKGFVKYDPKGSASELELVSMDDNNYYAGAYYNGTVYSYVYDLYADGYKIRYIKLDAQTFTVQSAQLVDMRIIPTDMTYDYTTNTMYATAQDLSTHTPYFGTVDMATGMFTSICVWDLPNPAHIILNLEAATDGTLYGVGTDGWLYDVNKTTGAVTRLRDMGIKTNWVCALVFDHYTQTMYWFPFTEKDGGKVVAFDPATGDTEFVDELGSSMTEFSCGFIFSDPDTFPEVDVKTYKVTFMDFEDNVAAEVEVREGRTAKAPEVKHPDGIPFVAWDKSIENVREDMVVKPLALGDVNNDYSLTAGDATMILRDVVGAVEIPSEKRAFADCNGNGQVDTADATLVLRYIVSSVWSGKN